ncbi:MAG: DUF6788 family protein [Patescibacteria group bacterium]
MSIKHRSRLSDKEREAVAKIHHLINEPGLLRASLVLMQRSCGRDYCRCLKSKKFRHRSWYIAQRYRGKPRMRFVSEGMERQARSWIERYRQIKQLLDDISAVYWEALKKKS